MKKVLLLTALFLGTLTSCEPKELNTCAEQVNDIIEAYAPALEELLPENPTEFNPLFDWTPFKEKLEERQSKIDAIGCN